MGTFVKEFFQKLEIDSIAFRKNEESINFKR